MNANFGCKLRFNRGWIAGTICCYIGLLLVSGCGKSEPEAVSTTPVQDTAAGAEAPADPFDMSELQNAFASSDGGTRLFVQEISDTIRGRDFVYALEQLQKLAQRPGLTPEQTQAVREAITKVQRWAASQRRR